MLINDLFCLAFNNLLLHKVRSLLTSLGIIFGVGSVIAMLAISNGAKKTALSQIAAMGIDNIIVSTKELKKSRGSVSGKGVQYEYGITHVDLGNIQKMENIKHITAVRNARVRITRGVDVLDTQMFWVSPEFIGDLSCKMVSGRWLSHPDYVNARSCCVIGKDVKRKLFALGEQRVIGRSIVVPSGVFTIVGIIENAMGATLEGITSINNSIFIPDTTGRQLFSEFSLDRSAQMINIHHVENDILVIKVKDTRVIDHTAKRIESLLGKSHVDKDWGVSVPLSLLRQKEKTQNIFTIVMGSIAAISLIVGGIGIMNIMLANVYERRKEIGTRRAMGAKKNDILFQFLIETVFLTIMGGAIGIGLGYGLSLAVTQFSGMPSEVSLWSIIGSITISGIVGIVFGTYPAWQAANQNPITALKSE